MFTSPHAGQPGWPSPLVEEKRVFGSSLRMQQSVEMITCDDSATAVDFTQQGTEPQLNEKRETRPTLDGPRLGLLSIEVTGCKSILKVHYWKGSKQC